MSFTNDAESKLLLSKAKDTVNLSDKRSTACFLGFLNEHESQLIKDSICLNDECMFWGGYNGAQRVIFGANVSDISCFPITAIKFTFKKEYELSHRDFLGALMSLGIERDTVGDILVFEGEAVVFVKTEIAQFIIGQIDKIGRVGVKLAKFDTHDFEFENEFDVLYFTISSLRIDVFVSAVCSLSREKSQKLIFADAVSVNHRIINNTSKTIDVGDVITIKKFGKFVFTENNGFSRKGKVKIEVKHFR